METTCPYCKATNQAGNECCAKCGKRLGRHSEKPTCPACGITFDKGTRDCLRCGGPLRAGEGR